MIKAGAFFRYPFCSLLRGAAWPPPFSKIMHIYACSWLAAPSPGTPALGQILREGYFHFLTLMSMEGVDVLIYSVFICKKCGGICATKEDSKTFKCTYCGTVNNVHKSRRLASGIDSRDIQKVIGELKMQRAASGGKETLQ